VALKGVLVGDGEVMPGLYLAIDPGGARGSLTGTPTKDPAFGLPATWIDAAQREAAQTGGHTVVDAGAVIATHVSHLIHANAATLLGRTEVQQLLDHFGKLAPKLVEDVVPKLVPLATLQRVLQNLLEDGLNVRDLRSVLETLAEHAGRTQDAGELTGVVRASLGASITQQIFGPARELQVLALEPDLERLLAQSAAGPADVLEPGLAEALVRGAEAAARRLESLGHAPALLVEERLRVPLARLLRRAVPQLKVLSHAEVPDNRIVRVAQSLGAQA